MRSLHISIFFLGILGFSLWTFLSGCDSQTDENRYIEEVVGEYHFNTFKFVPESSVLPPVNVLDTLVTEETRLQLFARFTLLYRFIGDDPAFVGGDFQATKSRVILKGNKEDEKFYVALLLPTEIELSRHPDYYPYVVP